MIITEKSLDKISKAEDIFKIVSALLESRAEDEKHKEFFYSLGLDSQNRILYVCLEAFGTVNACIPYIREILRNAIVKNAVSIIIAHNHPSGATNPSMQDTEFTRALKSACDIVQCKLLDHIIIGDEFYSFADTGKI